MIFFHIGDFASVNCCLRKLLRNSRTFQHRCPCQRIEFEGKWCKFLRFSISLFCWNNSKEHWYNFKYLITLFSISFLLSLLLLTLPIFLHIMLVLWSNCCSSIDVNFIIIPNLTFYWYCHYPYLPLDDRCSSEINENLILERPCLKPWRSIRRVKSPTCNSSIGSVPTIGLTRIIITKHI